MNTRLEDFLALPDTKDIEAEIQVNERIGTIRVRPMTQDQYRAYQNKGRVRDSKDRSINFDFAKFNLAVVAGQTVDPDFANADMLARAGCNTAEDFIKAKLLPGEVAKIYKRIAELSGFEPDREEEGIEEAKNS